MLSVNTGSCIKSEEPLKLFKPISVSSLGLTVLKFAKEIPSISLVTVPLSCILNVLKKFNYLLIWGNTTVIVSGRWVRKPYFLPPSLSKIPFLLPQYSNIYLKLSSCHNFCRLAYTSTGTLLFLYLSSFFLVLQVLPFSLVGFIIVSFKWHGPISLPPPPGELIFGV